MTSTLSASERRERARAAAAAGDHEFALAEYIWYHDHVLETEPAQYGVRLSHALRDWMDLARAYPPALAALQRIRDVKTHAVRVGEGTRELFHDVASINEELDQQHLTVQLFREIVNAQPELAVAVRSIVFPALVGTGDLPLARKCAPDEDEFRRTCQRMAKLLRQERPFPDLDAEEWRRICVRTYVKGLRPVILTFRGVGEHEQAARLRDIALEQATDDNTRALLADALDAP